MRAQLIGPNAGEGGASETLRVDMPDAAGPTDLGFQ